MDQAVERVVAVMRNRYHERLYVPELAADEYFSSFHFSRIFRRETGASPCQYLTAVRLFEAKRLLRSTSLSVADVACQVGYPGVGTFTTRFTKLVGVSPGRYRQLPAEKMLCLTEEASRLPDVEPAPMSSGAPASGRHASISLSIHFGHSDPVGRLLIAVFDEPIPLGSPVLWAMLSGADDLPLRLDGVPEGELVVVAAAEEHSAIRFDIGAPVRTRAGTTAAVHLTLHRPRRTDPPVLVALGDGPATTNRMAA
jgi:AraC family transcriptional regulator